MDSHRKVRKAKPLEIPVLRSRITLKWEVALDLGMHWDTTQSTLQSQTSPKVEKWAMRGFSVMLGGRLPT
jgi:hypothetical protein